MYIHLLAGGYVYDHDWKDTNSGVAPGDMRVFPTIIILRFFLSFFPFLLLPIDNFNIVNLVVSHECPIYIHKFIND